MFLKKTVLFFILVIVVLLVLVCGCNKKSDVPVTGLTFSESAHTMLINETKELKPVFVPENATNKNLTWATTNPKIVSVSNDGLITALNSGSVVISAKAGDGVFVATCAVNVEIPIDAISFDVSEVYIPLTQNYQVKTLVLPEDASSKSLIWETTDPKVASVSQDGLVTALEVGVSTISAKSSNGKIASLTVVCENEKLTDIDGNVYNTIKFGDQVWTVENLRTTRYNDGTPITFLQNKADWAFRKTEGFGYYNNSTDFIKKFGALYNGFVIVSNKLAPKGWHIPTQEDVEKLKNYFRANYIGLDAAENAYKLAKIFASKTDWHSSTLDGSPGKDPESNNLSGFCLLPSGCCTINGLYDKFGDIGYFWTLTPTDPIYGDMECLVAYAVYYKTYTLDKSFGAKSMGFSVRLVKD